MDDLGSVSVLVRHYRVVPTRLAVDAIRSAELRSAVAQFWNRPAQYLGHAARVELPDWVEEAIVERDGRGCRNPHCPEHRRHRGKRQIDHRIPVVKFGDDQLSNLQLLCPTCNRRKLVSSWRDFVAREEARART